MTNMDEYRWREHGKSLTYLDIQETYPCIKQLLTGIDMNWSFSYNRASSYSRRIFKGIFIKTRIGISLACTGTIRTPTSDIGFSCVFLPCMQ